MHSKIIKNEGGVPLVKLKNLIIFHSEAINISLNKFCVSNYVYLTLGGEGKVKTKRSTCGSIDK